MSIFDSWMREHYPDILMRFSRRPQAELHLTLWYWILRKQKYLVVIEWLHAVRQPSHSQ
jgi:hypothetical protein